MELDSSTKWGLDRPEIENVHPIELTKVKSSKLCHETRSVLHALLGYLDILHEEINQNLDESQNELLDRIVTYANRLTTLLDDMVILIRKQDTIT
jgi:signal transduction histidine kinase